MNDYMSKLTPEEAEFVTKILRTLIATVILHGMMETPAHGRDGETSKQAKVRAAFDYADLLMKG